MIVIIRALCCHFELPDFVCLQLDELPRAAKEVAVASVLAQQAPSVLLSDPRYCAISMGYKTPRGTFVQSLHCLLNDFSF
jgi:hypothetical protein